MRSAWSRTAAQTRYLAEFGVVFLMFSIGLEFSLPRLKSMRRIVFGLGGAQVALTILPRCLIAGSSLGRYFGVGLPACFALGAALAMSSTAIVMKLIAERLQLDTEHGKRIVGVLLFQDLAVVPLLVVIPALAADTGRSSAGRWALAVLKAAALLAVLLAGGQRVLRWWLHLVAKRKSHELFTLNVLLVTLGLAWLTEIAGLSLALGAFVAGMLIAETEFRHQVDEDIKPFRDVLLGLFFVTIGMLLNPRVVVEHLRLGHARAAGAGRIQVRPHLPAGAAIPARRGHRDPRRAGAVHRGRVRLRAARARGPVRPARRSDPAGRAGRDAAFDAGRAAAGAARRPHRDCGWRRASGCRSRSKSRRSRSGRSRSTGMS